MNVPELNVNSIKLSDKKFDIDAKTFINATTLIVQDQGPGIVQPYNLITFTPNGTVTTVHYVPRDIDPRLKEPELVADCLEITTAYNNTIRLEYRTATSGDQVIEYVGPHLQDQRQAVFRDKDGFIKLSHQGYTKYIPTPEIGYAIYVRDMPRPLECVPALVNALMMLYGKPASVFYNAIGNSRSLIMADVLVTTDRIVQLITQELLKLVAHPNNIGVLLTNTLTAFTLNGRPGC